LAGEDTPPVENPASTGQTGSTPMLFLVTLPFAVLTFRSGFYRGRFQRWLQARPDAPAAVQPG